MLCKSQVLYATGLVATFWCIWIAMQVSSDIRWLRVMSGCNVAATISRRYPSVLFKVLAIIPFSERDISKAACEGLRSLLSYGTSHTYSRAVSAWTRANLDLNCPSKLNCKQSSLCRMGDDEISNFGLFNTRECSPYYTLDSCLHRRHQLCEPLLNIACICWPFGNGAYTKNFVAVLAFCWHTFCIKRCQQLYLFALRTKHGQDQCCIHIIKCEAT